MGAREPGDGHGCAWGESGCICGEAKRGWDHVRCHDRGVRHDDACRHVSSERPAQHVCFGIDDVHRACNAACRDDALGCFDRALVGVGCDDTPGPPVRRLLALAGLGEKLAPYGAVMAGPPLETPARARGAGCPVGQPGCCFQQNAAVGTGKVHEHGRLGARIAGALAEFGEARLGQHQRSVVGAQDVDTLGRASQHGA